MPLNTLDRRVGRVVRDATRRLPWAGDAARTAAGGLGPGFRVAVALLLVGRRTRRAGVEMLASGAVASTVARVARTRVARPRPEGSARAGGGFPSRHAAAAAAIARAGSRLLRAGRPLGIIAAAGLIGRVISGDHEPGDVAAGVLLGVACDRLVARAARSGAVHGTRAAG